MRKSDLILALCLLLLIVGSVALILAPSVGARLESVREIERLEAEYARPFNGPEVVERLNLDLQTLKAFGEGRMTPIPDDSDIAGLMGSLGSIIKSLKLEQRDITMRQARALEGASVMPVAITIFGDFEKVYSAIGSIEKLDRLVRVGRLRVVAGEGAGGKFTRAGIVKAELTIDAFYRPTSLAAVEETKP